MKSTLSTFELKNRVAVITGGAGFLGAQHAEAIAEGGGSPVLWDICAKEAEKIAEGIQRRFSVSATSMDVDITAPDAVRAGLERVLEHFGHVDILINNAANNPPPEFTQVAGSGRLEHFTLDQWNEDLAVGITGAFICSQVIGDHMARSGGGVILNIASDLGVIAPDQRIYRDPHLSEDEQPIKPITYSVVKHALIGLTKYLATYWADKNVRVNAISPGGMYNGQPEHFVSQLRRLIPLGRMAERDEYKAAVLFLVSDASSYMTGANLIIDGGRTCW